MQSVIYSHFNDLRRKKSLAEGRKISLRTVAAEVNLSYFTIQHIASASSEGLAGVKLSTIEVLCKYFGVPFGELIEYRED